MGRFKKAAEDDDLEPLKFSASSSLPSLDADPLKFTVETSDRTFVELDLTRYRDGNNKLGLMGFPNLIVDLLPTIKRQIGQKRRNRRGINNWLTESIAILFKAVSEIKRLTGVAPESADDFQDADGVLLKSYLMGLGGSAQRRKKQYVVVYTIICRARSKTAPPLRWPSFEIAPERKVHVDVDPRAVKAFYHTCKRVVEEAEQISTRGQLLLAGGIDPRASGPRRHGPVKNPAWRSHGNLAILQRMAIKDRILGTKQLDRQTITKISNHTTSTSGLFSGIRRRELLAANATSSLEVTAAILLVSMETGWIDTVWGIDLTGKWYSLRRGDRGDSLGKTDSVVLHAIRPKTSKPITAIGLAGSRFRSFQLIRSLEERTAFLRECLRERRAQLEDKELNTTERTEIAQIDRRLRSPWLFYNGQEKNTLAVGLVEVRAILNNLPALKAQAIATLGPNKSQDTSLIAAIEALRWSDLRDAFALHIFESSGGNIFSVKRALDHNHVATTRCYLRQKRHIQQRFDAFRKVMDTALIEVKEGRTVDPTILFLASNYAGFNNSDRERLTAFRTRMDMGCFNPTKPDKHLAPNHIEGTRCTVQRCVLCRHGVVFKDAYGGLADRHADLAWLRSRIPPGRWLTSSLSWELEAIELVRDNVFADHTDAFNMRSKERLKEIAAGRAHVFDDPEIIGGLH